MCLIPCWIPTEHLPPCDYYLTWVAYKRTLLPHSFLFLTRSWDCGFKDGMCNALVLFGILLFLNMHRVLMHSLDDGNSCVWLFSRHVWMYPTIITSLLTVLMQESSLSSLGRSFTALLQKKQKHADGSAVYPPEMGRATAFLSWIEEEFAVGMEPLQELLEAMKQHNEIQNLKELTIVALHTDRP